MTTWLHRRRTKKLVSADSGQAAPLPLVPIYAGPHQYPVRLQRLIVRMDNARRVPVYERVEHVAYGVLFPDGKIALWHETTERVELHWNLASIRAWYAWQGNMTVQFLDREDTR